MKIIPAITKCDIGHVDKQVLSVQMVEVFNIRRSKYSYYVAA